VLVVVVVPDDLRITCSAPIERLLRIWWVTVLLSSVHSGLGWRLQVTLAVAGCWYFVEPVSGACNGRRSGADPNRVGVRPPCYNRPSTARPW
jgi:hypothetical protein